MKPTLLIFSFLFLLHAVRDVMQMKGVKNWFTEFGHVWDKPEWEKYSVIFCLIMGLLLLYRSVY